MNLITFPSNARASCVAALLATLCAFTALACSDGSSGSSASVPYGKPIADSGKPVADSGKPSTDGGKSVMDSGKPGTGTGMPGTGTGTPGTGTGTPGTFQRFAVRQTNLVANKPGVAVTTDPNLVNSWGLVANPTAGLFWVANAETGLVTVYPPSGGPSVLNVEVPGPSDKDGGFTSAPTGQVFNATTDFYGDKFIVDTEDGTIAGWQTLGQPFVRRFEDPGKSIYKGLAMIQNDMANELVATNFHKGTVDVFDAMYMRIPKPGFVDQGFPALPADYAPFNVAWLGGWVYVTYAQQDEDKKDDVTGAGKGFVSVFNPDGTFMKRLISHGALDAPWGMAIAPASWAKFAGALLVGNFGDGTINAYDRTTGEQLGSLKTKAGQRLKIDGLWSIVPGPTTQMFDFSNFLYFTAGPNDEEDGLFGVLDMLPI